MAYTDIDKPSDYFNTKLYTGNGGAQTITGVNFEPNLIWIKQRNGTGNHVVTDTVRTVDYQLHTNTTDADSSLTNNVTSTNSDGFVVNTDGEVNGSSDTYVAWNWKEQAGVMDIVTYTGNGSNRTIAHNLGVKPAVMIHKGRSNTYNWGVYHHALSPSNERSLNFNTNGAVNVDDGGVYYNSTDPTSSVFSLGTNVGYNANSATYVAYLFAEKQGYSKFGSYTGNGDVDGSTIWCGFSPAFIMIKCTDLARVWRMWDNKRDVNNPNTANFQAQASNAEYDDPSVSIDFLSSGFKVRSTDSSYNGSGNSYVYMAFAENPFVTSTGVPATAR
jgi:hypothetical protein